MAILAQGGNRASGQMPPRRKRRLKLKPAPLVILLVLGFALYSFAGQMVKMYSVSTDVEKIEAQMQVLQKKNTQLKAEIEQLKKPEYVEKVAREELRMVKPGEEIVVPVTGQISTP